MLATGTLVRSTLRHGAKPARRRAPLSAPQLHTTLPRWNSSSSTGGAGLSKGSPGRAVAFALGALGSAAFGYYLASSQKKDEPAYISSTELNTKYGSPADFKKAIEELQKVFHEDAVTTDPEDLRVHGYSEYDYHPGSPPTVVVFPLSTEDVVKIVQIANKYKMPVTPYSGATSLEGHFRAPAVGGICVDVSGMDKILEIHEKDSDLVCQPGARWMDINDTLKKKGISLFFPLDPAPGATIGGMISTGCSGTNAVRYGTAKGEWILNVTVVLPSGEVIKTRRRSRKSSAGFDTTKLFVGAEGTLGIITEATIRLTPLLPTSVAVAQFPNVRAATEVVIDVLNAGVGIQCVELCDDEFMKSTNIYGMSPRKWPERDSLFFKFQGPTPRALQESADITRKICAAHGGTGFVFAKDDTEAALLWQDRKNALFSGLALLENSRGWSTDVCVPVSRLPQLVYETKEDLERTGLASTIVGHVGDGNFHALLLFKDGDEQGLKTATDAVHRMVERAIALDGTCTGEHGVGIGKKEYLIDELGEGTVNLMKTVKKTIDPYNLFNPGKLYPDPKSGSEHPHGPTPSQGNMK